MMNKLKQRLYDTPEQVIADARLIFENCRTYNEEESEICKVREVIDCAFCLAKAGSYIELCLF